METHLTNRSASFSSSAGWVAVVERLCLASSSSTTANIILKRGSAGADAGATEAVFSDRQLGGGGGDTTGRRAEAERQPQQSTLVILLASFTIRFRRGTTSEAGSPNLFRSEQARRGQNHSGFAPHHRAWETQSIVTRLQTDIAGASLWGHSGSPSLLPAEDRRGRYF